MKRCYKCRITKPLPDFNRDRSRPDGRMNRCKVCMATFFRQRGRGQPSQALPYRQAMRHGLTVEKLEELLAGGCGVCGSMTGLVVDHDHSCCPRPAKNGKLSCGGCIRGVLCSKHNLALGKLGDNLDGVMRLVEYLLKCSR